MRDAKIAKVTGLFFIFTMFFAVTSARAQSDSQAVLERQMLEILKSQKAIEQRLTVMESRQSSLMNAMSAFCNALRPGSVSNMGAGAGGGCGGAAAGGPPSEDFNKVYKIDAGNSLVQGTKEAKVTIVEFSDFQCPFSQRFHPIFMEVVKAYPSDVNYVFKNYPLGFHPQAKPAAKASLAAREQGKYWEMVEELFLSGKELSEDKFKELAGKLGLDVEKFMKDYKEKDAQWEKLLAEDFTLAQSVAVGGTPTFYINGKKTSARDVAGLKQEIETILKSPQASDEKGDAKKDKGKKRK